MTIAIRDKLIDLGDRIENRRASRSEATAAFLGEVVDGGSMPDGPEKFYLLRATDIDGSEHEGSLPTFAADELRDIPVIVLGSTPVVGDLLTAYAIGGRWIAQKGIASTSCQPQIPGCGSTYYGDNGTVTDAINGTQPIVYDFVARAWFSAWLPLTSDYVLATAPNESPCVRSRGPSYYYYRLNSTNVDLARVGITASLFLPGQMCVDNHGASVFSIFQYPHGTAQYPALLGNPAISEVPGVELPSAVMPTRCDPAKNIAVFDTTTAMGTAPLTTATFDVPKWVKTSYKWTCGNPCPLPRKDLHLSWVNTNGNGSGVLVYEADTRRWNLACDHGLAVKLSMSGAPQVRFDVTLRDNNDCTGGSLVYTYPTQIKIDSYVCDPLMLVYSPIYKASPLYSRGYRTFTITE